MWPVKAHFFTWEMVTGQILPPGAAGLKGEHATQGGGGGALQKEGGGELSGRRRVLGDPGEHGPSLQQTAPVTASAPASKEWDKEVHRGSVTKAPNWPTVPGFRSPEGCQAGGSGGLSFQGAPVFAVPEGRGWPPGSEGSCTGSPRTPDSPPILK